MAWFVLHFKAKSRADIRIRIVVVVIRIWKTETRRNRLFSHEPNWL